jgi:tetratricopeptide (TPR) repeat protein
MKWVYLLKFVLLLGPMLPYVGLAQEEESAEISLEDYTDAFQESFFEALKQKGIENYDKAINALLKCKELDPDSHVVDHELARAYKLDNQIALAQEYALNALQKQPENLWYLNTYLGMMNMKSLELNTLKSKIPYGNPKLKENLAAILVEKGEYELASELLKQLKKTTFTEQLLGRIADSLERKNNKTYTPSVGKEEKEDPLRAMVRKLQDLMDRGRYEELNEESTEALEGYPLQPFFYFTKGVALNGISDFEQAVEYLTMGLDFIDQDVELTNNFYRQLAVSYRALGESAKANMYLSKIKNGS